MADELVALSELKLGWIDLAKLLTISVLEKFLVDAGRVLGFQNVIDDLALHCHGKIIIKSAAWFNNTISECIEHDLFGRDSKKANESCEGTGYVFGQSQFREPNMEKDVIVS